jgi:hypothetical protein
MSQAMDHAVQKLLTSQATSNTASPEPHRDLP